MRYLLDTNVLVAMFRGQHGIREAILKAGMSNCAVSEITFAELLTGTYKGGFERHSHEIQFLQDNFEILPISPVLETFARLCASMEKQGTPLDGFDLLIASSAMSGKMTLITHNTRHFSRIPGLKFKDWEK
ncbi:MAG: PIN domain-containing protein [Bacteroidales bacterium]|nr:PIN domain-containing protein [Bacteroidales bacterium]